MKQSLLTAALIAITLFFVAKYLFVVKKINVHPAQDCLNEQSLEKNGDLIGKNIIFTNTANLAKTLKNQNSCLEAVSVSRSLPSTIDISVSTKVPVAKIDGTDLLATADGLVIKQQQQTASIPTIYLPSGIQAKQGTKISNQTVLFALQISSGLLKSDFTPASVRIISTQDIAVYSTNETVALFRLGTSTNEQVDSLQSILTKAKIDASKIAKIDLRFDKPVIVFK